MWILFVIWKKKLHVQQIVWICLECIYLNKVKTTSPSLNVKWQEVEGDHIALWLVDDPLTDLVVGIGIGVVWRAYLPSPRQSTTTSWGEGGFMEETKLKLCGFKSVPGSLIFPLLWSTCALPVSSQVFTTEINSEWWIYSWLTMFGFAMV